MYKRDKINFEKSKLTLNISKKLCEHDNIILDVVDLLILDYVNTITLFCRPSLSEDNSNQIAYDSDGKFNFSALSLKEFDEMYVCLPYGFDKDFQARLDMLVKLNLLDVICVEGTSLYRTSALYDELRGM